MGPIISFLKWVTGQLTEERKARAEEEKARFYALQVLNQEYRIKIEEQDRLIESLKDGTSGGSLKECIDREMDLHGQIIDLLKTERDLKEEIIFLKILKSQNDES